VTVDQASGHPEHPEHPPTPGRLDRAVVAFVRSLRAAGLTIPVDAAIAYAAALAEVGMGDRGSVYWAGRATLVQRPEDIGTYDRTFAVFYAGHVAADVSTELAPPPPVTVVVDADHDEPPVDGGPEPEPLDGPVLALQWSDREVLRDKDFAACTTAELDEAHRLMADLRLAGARRRSRRRRAARRGQIDLGRTLRQALRTGGEPLDRSHRAHGSRARRLVLLLDISGSMEPYARALLRFAHTAVTGRARVEVFALGTRLTRLTRELASRDPDAALGQAAAAVEDWSGGTRLGDSLRAFNDTWGVRGMARGAEVVILSDGWDRGDPEVMDREMGRLARVAHRVVWVNPLKATPGYEPLARGMAAALPHLDRFVAGHSLRSLEELATVLGDDGRRQRRPTGAGR
jgi:uncharacterized protein